MRTHIPRIGTGYTGTSGKKRSNRYREECTNAETLVVRQGRLELSTLRLEISCSIQLSYWRILKNS